MWWVIVVLYVSTAAVLYALWDIVNLYVMLLGTVLYDAWYTARMAYRIVTTPTYDREYFVREILRCVQRPPAFRVPRECEDELIPFLPNDVVMHEIIARLGRKGRMSAMRVSKAWARAVCDCTDEIRIYLGLISHSRDLATKLRILDSATRITYLYLDTRDTDERVVDAFSHRMLARAHPTHVTTDATRIETIMTSVRRVHVLTIVDDQRLKTQRRFLEPIALELHGNFIETVNHFTDVRALSMCISDNHPVDWLVPFQDTLEDLRLRFVPPLRMPAFRSMRKLRTLHLMWYGDPLDWDIRDTPALRDVYMCYHTMPKDPVLSTRMQRVLAERGCRVHYEGQFHFRQFARQWCERLEREYKRSIAKTATNTMTRIY